MKALGAFSLGMLFFSCKKERTNDKEAAVKLVIQKVEANTPTCVCDPLVNEYKWNNETVYVQYAAGPACNSVPVYYNKNGQQMVVEGISFDDFLKESIFIRNIWTCNEN
jgi:hypothetical protein